MTTALKVCPPAAERAALRLILHRVGLTPDSLVHEFNFDSKTVASLTDQGSKARIDLKTFRVLLHIMNMRLNEIRHITPVYEDTKPLLSEINKRYMKKDNSAPLPVALRRPSGLAPNGALARMDRIHEIRGALRRIAFEIESDNSPDAGFDRADLIALLNQTLICLGDRVKNIPMNINTEIPNETKKLAEYMSLLSRTSENLRRLCTEAIKWIEMVWP